MIKKKIQEQEKQI